MKQRPNNDSSSDEPSMASNGAHQSPKLFIHKPGLLWLLASSSLVKIISSTRLISHAISALLWLATCAASQVAEDKMSREMQNKQATNDKRKARMPIKCSTGWADFLFIQEKKRKDKIFCFHPFAIAVDEGEGG